jgi:hypothetical protein
MGVGRLRGTLKVDERNSYNVIIVAADEDARVLQNTVKPSNTPRYHLKNAGVGLPPRRRAHRKKMEKRLTVVSIRVKRENVTCLLLTPPL